MKPLKSFIVTAVIMGLFWWCYVLTDMYAWGAHQVLQGILTVAGMLFIGLTFYAFLRFGKPDRDVLQKQKNYTYKAGNSGMYQR